MKKLIYLILFLPIFASSQNFFWSHTYIEEAGELPTVTTNTPTNVLVYTVTLGGNVTSDGGATVTERGVVYSMTSNPTIANNKVQIGSGTGVFSQNISGLTCGTTYYARAYAINSAGVAYGNEVNFTLSTNNLASFSFLTTMRTSCDTISIDTYELSVQAIENESNPLCTYSSYSSSGAGYRIESFEVSKQTYSFTNSCLPLTQTRWVVYKSFDRYYSVYLLNGVINQIIEYQRYEYATVNTFNPSNITNSSAYVGGQVLADGGSNVFNRGIVWNTSGNPTISDNVIQLGSGIGSFYTTIESLSCGTTYYYNSYAINAAGVTYGEQKSFTPSSTYLPQYNLIDYISSSCSSYSINDYSSAMQACYDYANCSNVNFGTGVNYNISSLSFGGILYPTSSQCSIASLNGYRLVFDEYDNLLVVYVQNGVIESIDLCN